MLETYEKESAASRQEGEIVRGIVVGISDQNVLVDIGYKSEGVVARESGAAIAARLTYGRGAGRFIHLSAQVMKYLKLGTSV